MDFNVFSWIYLAILIVTVVVEMIGVISKKKNDTITEHVRFFMKKKVIWFTALGFWVWLTIHFFTGLV